MYVFITDITAACVSFHFLCLSQYIWDVYGSVCMCKKNFYCVFIVSYRDVPSLK